MLPASNRGAGMNIGFPDTCLTPVGPAVVPIPYPNFAMNAQAASFSPNVLLTAMPALNMGSVIPMSTGDEPGVAHWTIKGPSTFTAGNPKVFINGLPGIDLTSPATSNTMNDGLDLQAVPSATNVFYTFASAEDVAQLDDALPRDGSAVEAGMAAEGVGLVRVRCFSFDAPARVHAALRRFAAEGVRALVLDLRGNPGGELSAAVAIAGAFLAPGSLVVTMRDEDGDEMAIRTGGGDPCDLPMVVLVDGGTASAAELLAGCLQAHGRAQLAGARTYGKGVGAAVGRDRSGAQRVVRAVFTLPGGGAVEGVGVVPDVALAPAEDAVARAAELLHDVG